MDKRVSNFNIRLRTIKLRELAVVLVISLLLTMILMVVFPELESSDELSYIVFLSLVLLFFIRSLKDTTGLKQNVLGVFKNSPEILYVFLINILFAFLFMFLISILDLLIGIGDPTWVSIWDIDNVDVDSAVLILDAITAVIFAPIVEELVFRGVLFNRLKIRIGIIPAMLISSFLFGIGHSFGSITSAFLFGMCMCILYLKTDNILIPMTVHFINNLVATILEVNSIDIMFAQFPWLIPCMIITLAATVYLIKYIITEIKKISN